MTRNKEDYNLRDVDVTKNRFGSAGQAIFEMTPRGFTFEAVESQQVDGKSSKKSKAEVVSDILTEPKTVQQICEETGASGAYLTTILRQLVTEGKIKKDGKGVGATYVKI
jgi:predicted Rossmann fold nucleotide-binding protein DprA/Smf involved in DNA uptake